MLGIVPAIFVIFVRRLVKDPEIYREAKAAQTEQPGEVLRDLRPGMLFTTCAPPADHRRAGRLLRDHLVAADLPQERARPERARHGGYLAMVIVGSYVGYVISAYLTDLLGRKRTSSCSPSARSPSCCSTPNCRSAMA
jgi:hypothetical protein